MKTRQTYFQCCLKVRGVDDSVLFTLPVPVTLNFVKSYVFWLVVGEIAMMILCLVFLLVPFLILWFIKVDTDLILLVCEFFYSTTKRNTLAGKVVWITGASGGIGETLAYDLARRGCKLVLSGRRENALLTVKDKCVQTGRKCLPDYKVKLSTNRVFHAMCPLDAFHRIVTQ